MVDSNANGSYLTSGKESSENSYEKHLSCITTMQWTLSIIKIIIKDCNANAKLKLLIILEDI